MNITYDPAKDELHIVLSAEPAGNTRQLDTCTVIGSSIIHEFGEWSCRLIGITVLHASRHIPTMALQELMRTAAPTI